MITYDRYGKVDLSGPPNHEDLAGSSTIRSPWQRLNLLRNPFGEHTLRERAELAIIPELDYQTWLAQCSQPFRAIQFIGRCGRGKTTRLIKLHSLAHQSHYVYIGEDKIVPTLPDAAPLIIDEAQRLRRPTRHQVFQSGVPLVLGTHRNLAGPLRAMGYQVITHRIGRSNDSSLILNFATRRIEAARYRAGEVPQLDASNAKRLRRKFGTNLRAIESFLYDQAQLLLNAQQDS